MEDEDEGFELWQYLASVRVEEDSNSHDTPIHHCPLPKCGTVAGMVELGQGQNHVTTKIRASSKDSLPATDHNPTYQS